MKKLISMGIVVLVLANMSLASAEIGGTITKSVPSPTYSSLELLLEAEGDTCEVATDGINSIMIENGKPTLSTLAYPGENPEYSCMKHIGDPEIYNTQEAFLAAEGKFCSTATDGINVIMVENGEFTISTLAYTPNPEYSCTAYKLSDNDMRLYKSVKSGVGFQYVEKVDAAIKTYAERMNMLRWSDERRQEAHQETIEKAEMMIFTLISKYPQDIALPTKASELHKQITLIKLELMLLDM